MSLLATANFMSIAILLNYENAVLASQILFVLFMVSNYWYFGIFRKLKYEPKDVTLTIRILINLYVIFSIITPWIAGKYAGNIG
jgi:hypothetical protein